MAHNESACPFEEAMLGTHTWSRRPHAPSATAPCARWPVWCHHIVAACGVIIVAAGGAGCSSGSEPSDSVSVPSSPPLTAPSEGGGPATGVSPALPRDVVIAAYHQYWDATRKAATVPEDQARALLQPVSTPKVIVDQIRGIRAVQGKHQEPWGKIVIRVYAVEVSGSTARLGDCQDTSGAGLADSRTHQLIPGTRGGAKPVNFSVKFERGTDRRWRVSSVRSVEAPCTPPSANSGT